MGWNEIVVDGRGNVYIKGGSGITVLTFDGLLRQVADGIAFPNGMTITTDNLTLIIAESYGKKLTAFDIAADSCVGTGAGVCAPSNLGKRPAARHAVMIIAGLKTALERMLTMVALVAGGRPVPARWGWTANGRMRHSGPVCSSARVAIDAGKLRVVRGNLVAIIAHGTIVRDREPGVVESRAQPARRCVAGIARCGISCRNVVWHGTAQRLRTVPFRQVAPITGRIRRGERIVVIDVASGAGLHAASRGYYMSAGQGPACRAVVKPAVDPEQRVVASRAQ